MIETPVTQKEDAFARAYVRLCNASAAYIEVYSDGPLRYRQEAWTQGHLLINKPHVRARINEYKAAAAEQYVAGVDAVMRADLELIEAYEQIQQLMRYVWDACRYCYGADHHYQWINLDEFTEALQTTLDDNEIRAQLKKRPRPLPTDEGGYGFSRHNSPNVSCPRCEGLGVQRAEFADTRTLTGAAARLFAGIKVGAQGQIEMITHSLDKAKERVMRRTGTYGDDPAAVARGAAAGAAMGAKYAESVAARVETMTPAEVQQAYLQLAKG
jgi:phage terminase small subunit